MAALDDHATVVTGVLIGWQPTPVNTPTRAVLISHVQLEIVSVPCVYRGPVSSINRVVDY